MGKALQCIAGRVTNPSTTFTALTANSGDSFTVRSFPFGSKAHLEQAWTMAATAGTLRIRSPRLHDASQAIRIRNVASIVKPLMPEYADQPLYPQDVLTVEMTGGAAETDAAAFQVYYEDLPGIDSRLARWEEIDPRIVNIASFEVSPVTSATAGQWGSTRALNADLDTFKRNVDYAILGLNVDTRCLAAAISGPDTGNLRCGVFGETDSFMTAGYFVDEARRTGYPHIPVINAANIGATNIEVASTATSATINVSVIMAELSRA